MDVSWIITTGSLLILCAAGPRAEDFEHLRKLPEAYCEKGWYPLGDLCYKGFKDFLNFQDAEKKCVELGGHLAVIHSQEVQDYVTVHIILALEHQAFIGLKHNESILSMHWMDGSVLDFQNWDANEPSKTSRVGKIEHCVEMTFNNVLHRLGKWNDIPCDYNLPYICQRVKGFEGEEPEKDPTLCARSTDGLNFRTSCYHFSPHRKSWEDAEKYCGEHYGGHLVAITDVAVQMFLSYSMTKLTTTDERMWIGIRLQPKKVALWVSGWYMGYNNWKHEFDYKGVSSDTCGAITKDKGTWDNPSCKESLSFICENSSAVPPARLNATTEGLTCPPGELDWTDLGGDMCYIIEVGTSITWYQANFICMTKGGTLASVHSEAEERIFAQFVRFFPSTLHIGLFRNDRRQASREFEWADGSKVDYIHWRYGEPNTRDEMCAEAMPHQGMLWNDIKCDIHAGYICSVPKVSSISKTEEKRNDEGVKDNSACECLPTGAIVGVVLCVLLVIVLVGVVVYNVKPCRKKQEDPKKKRKNSLNMEKPRYRRGERVISEELYENIDREY